MTFYIQTLLKIKAGGCYAKAHLIRRVIRAKQFMDLHFAENIDLSSVASEAHCSKFHFIRCFKSLYGRTPHQHLISIRIENARRLLELDYSVADVCYTVGFDSVSSFIGLFKKMTGTTPAVYRDRKKQFSRIESPGQCGPLPHHP